MPLFESFIDTLLAYLKQTLITFIAALMLLLYINVDVKSIVDLQSHRIDKLEYKLEDHCAMLKETIKELVAQHDILRKDVWWSDKHYAVLQNTINNLEKQLSERQLNCTLK